MELMVPLKTRSAVPLYEQIYQYIKDEIKRGALPPAAKLPSTRALAEHLKVSRSTTQMAYEQLLSEGYIEAEPCRGYFVARIENLLDMSRGNAGQTLPPPMVMAGGKVGLGEANGGETGRILDFSPRGIDLSSFPFNTWRKITRNTLVDDNREMFAAGDPQGEPGLREAIRSYLHSARGVNCRADQIIVGAGSEYLLMLLHQILGPERRIAMENPTYKQAYRVLKSLGHEVVPVEMDQHGIGVGLLRESGADIAYVMPSHQYPTGIVMPVKRRQELLNWACEGGGRYLIEDDYDSEFRYKGKPIPALQGIDRQGRVIYLGTFSKSVAPAIRVSFMVLPESLWKIYRETYHFYASTVSRIDQNILYQFIVEGFYERHLNRMRAVYRSKHDALLSALKPLEKEFRIRGEYAGLHLLLTHREGMAESELVEAAFKAGVRVYGLSSYFIEEKEQRPWGDASTVVLGYANLTEAEIACGVGLLREAWRQ